jgi:hypothetical protein
MILSLNSCWEALNGVNLRAKSFSTSGIDIKTPKQSLLFKKKVQSNILNYLNSLSSNNISFFLFQEAKQILPIFHKLKFAHKYNSISNYSNKNVVRTFFNKKYKLIKSASIKGEFEPGRPFLITPFSNKVCIINVHMPHMIYKRSKSNTYTRTKNSTSKHQTEINVIECRDLLEKSLQKIENKINKMGKSLQKFKIFFAGDFNLDIDFNKIPIWNFTLQNKNGKLFTIHMKDMIPKQKTCCYHKIKSESYLYKLDHILIDSNNKNKYKVKVGKIKKPNSDHRPIILY